MFHHKDLTKIIIGIVIVVVVVVVVLVVVVVVVIVNFAVAVVAAVVVVVVPHPLRKSLVTKKLMNGAPQAKILKNMKFLVNENWLKVTYVLSVVVKNRIKTSYR